MGGDESGGCAGGRALMRSGGDVRALALSPPGEATTGRWLSAPGRGSSPRNRTGQRPGRGHAASRAPRDERLSAKPPSLRCFVVAA